jgi:hypothetical protein
VKFVELGLVYFVCAGDNFVEVWFEEVGEHFVFVVVGHVELYFLKVGEYVLLVGGNVEVYFVQVGQSTRVRQKVNDAP